MLKKILIGIGLLLVVIVVALVAAVMLAPTDFAVEREIVVNKPRAEVFEYAKNLRNQNDWGPWFKKDPAMKQEFVGTDGTAGFTSKWESKNPEVGKGEQEIKRVMPNERIESELRFIEPFASKADAHMTFEDAGANQTKVKWGFAGSMPRPMNIFLLLVDMNDAVGKDFQDGLNSLKTILEKS
ncbi:MAG: SRPBCC family protein [Pyrinomonadaceae bacterium]